MKSEVSKRGEVASPFRRRRLFAGAFAIAATLAIAALSTERANADAASTVLVFVPSDEKPRDIQNALSARMPGLEVIVFGKPKDLEQAVRQDPPGAVIAPGPTLQSIGLGASLRGTRGGSTNEPYVLLTVDYPVAPASLADKTVGMFGLMGRNEMKSLGGKLLGNGDQKITTVTKFADLLPLLQFQAAAGVLLPKREATVLKARSELKIVVAELSNGGVGLVSTAIRPGGSSGKITSALKSLDRATLTRLGIEGWQ